MPAKPWNETSIVAAIKLWVEETGEAPSAVAWGHSVGGRRNPHPHWLAHRDRFPSYSTVVYHCESWSGALKEADVEQRPAGRQSHRSPKEAAKMAKARKRVERRQLAEKIADAQRELRRFENAA